MTPGGILRGKILLGHRGTCIMAPENTIPAFDFALRHGAHALETDVRLSRDGHLIVTHDDTLDRTTNGRGLIIEHTLAALQTLDAGFHHTIDDRQPFRGQGICLITLGQMLERYPQIPINIDIKDDLPEAAEAIFAVLQEHEALDRIVLASFHDRMLSVVRRKNIGALTSAGVSDMKAMMLCHLMRRHKHFAPEPDFYQIPPWHKGIPLASAGFIRSIHRCGRRVHYWTINNPAQAARLLRRGADGIVSDRADLMAPLFHEHRAQ